MYKCNDCDEEFEEPYRYVETHGFTDGLYEHWAVCPCCGSPDFDLEFEWDSSDDYSDPEEVSLN